MLIEGAKHAAAVTTAVAHASRILGRGRLGDQAGRLGVGQDLNRLVDVDSAAHLVIQIILAHGAEHETGFKRFVA